MKWVIIDKSESRVVEATEWLPITEYKKLQARAGVYIFADDNFDVKYIGKAGAGRMIVEVARTKEKKEVSKMIYEINSAIYRKKNTGATLVMALYTNSDDVALELEQELIAKYDPINNGIDLLKS